MRRHNLAADGEQETGETILVDTSAKEGEQVTRRAPRAAKTNGVSANEEWVEKSRKVQKRLVQQARAFEQRTAEREAEFNRQLALRDERITRLERGGDATPTDEAAHAKVMDEFEKKIAEAQELGDSAGVAKLTRQMTEADGRYWAAKTSKATGAAAKADTAAAAKVAPTQITPSPAGQKWAKANTEWWDDTTDRTHVAARAFANALYKDKVDQGDDRDDPEFYEEIRQELAKRFPEIETISTTGGKRRQADPDDEDEDEDDVQQQPVRRAPSLSMPNRGDIDRSRPNRLATITGADQRLMKSVGLNPNDNKHVLQFLASRNEEANAE